MFSKLDRISLFGLVVGGSCVVLLAGCGPSGPPRYDLSGKVMYDGELVPAGRVILEPDSSAGNRGPRSVALIQEGQYQTQPREGVLGGAYRVMIYGGDGKITPMQPDGNPLFPLYETKLDLPREPSTHDFAVPQSR